MSPTAFAPVGGPTPLAPKAPARVDASHEPKFEAALEASVDADEAADEGSELELEDEDDPAAPDAGPPSPQVTRPADVVRLHELGALAATNEVVARRAPVGTPVTGEGAPSRAEPSANRRPRAEPSTESAASNAGAATEGPATKASSAADARQVAADPSRADAEPLEDPGASANPGPAKRPVGHAAPPSAAPTLARPESPAGKAKLERGDGPRDAEAIERARPARATPHRSDAAAVAAPPDVTASALEVRAVADVAAESAVRPSGASAHGTSPSPTSGASEPTSLRAAAENGAGAERVRAAETAGHRHVLTSVHSAHGVLVDAELGRVDVVARAEAARIEVHVRAQEEETHRVLAASGAELRAYVQVDVPNASVRLERATSDAGSGSPTTSTTDHASGGAGRSDRRGFDGHPSSSSRSDGRPTPRDEATTIGARIRAHGRAVRFVL